MASIRQIEANRQNAIKSTGPNTSGGRVRSNRNALRHGLSAKNLVVGDETAEALVARQESYFDEFNPEGAAEQQLVNQLALAELRIKRAQEAEAEAFGALSHKDSGVLSVMSFGDGSVQDKPERFQSMLRYVAIAERSWFRALSALIQLQERRGKRSDAGTLKALPLLEKAKDAEQALRSVVEGLRQGTIPMEYVTKIVRIIEAFMKITDRTQLEEGLRDVEKLLETVKKQQTEIG